MMPGVDKLSAWARHYATLQGVGDYTFSVEIVPGLKHDGSDAWATVEPDVKRRTAIVKVRDIDATPIPGFDGDTNYELRVTISHEMFHLLVADWIANPTIENEERVVEAAAQAVVRSEFGADARVVARSISAIPKAIRARVAVATRHVMARASRSRKGRAMDPKILMEALDALIAGDTAKCAEILKALVASAASGAAPTGDELPAREGDPAKLGGEPPKPDARGAAAREDEQPMARARVALEAETARARKGADMSVSTGIRGRLRELRTVEGVELDAKLEASLAAMRDPDAFEQRVADLLAGRALAAQGGQRARSGAEHGGTPPPANGGAPESAEKLAGEGFDQRFIVDYQAQHKADPRAAAATLEGGRAARARKASSAGRGN